MHKDRSPPAALIPLHLCSGGDRRESYPKGHVTCPSQTTIRLVALWKVLKVGPRQRLQLSEEGRGQKRRGHSASLATAQEANSLGDD